MMKIIMELQGISKHYREKIVLENMSFSIYDNQVVALVGKNGSGKSTLLKIIGGLVKPDSGLIHKHTQPLKIGYVPEVTPSHILFTPEEYLTHMGNIRGMAKGQIQQRIDSLIETFNLQDARKIRIEHFSKGMKQKVAIMQAMLEETDLLILDEPLSGLDPKAQSDLESILLILKEKGLSIVLTCHETKLLENIVDSVLLIKDHQIIQTSLLQESVNKGNRFIFEISTETSLEELLPFIEIKQERRLNSEVNEIEATVNREITDKILMELLIKGASIKQLLPIRGSEENFHSHF